MLTDSHLLADGELEYTADASEIRLTYRRDGKRRPGQLTMRSPREGIGSADFVVSPDERLAALCLASGQSEVGLELFALRPRLRGIFSVPYRQGESGPPKFSPDSAWLALLVRTPHHTWYDDRSAERPDDPGWTLPWAELYALHFPDRTLTRTAIDIAARTPPPGQDLDPTWATHRRLLAVTADAVEIKLPWGERTRLPLPGGGTTTRTYPGPQPP